LEAAGFTQDPDVLDTWFSSALWPMSTLKWPENSPELQTWNPTSVLCTAREIITLWVSRMVMFNLYFLDRLPFRDVFIHAMIQDGEGRKMSKTLGNGVDPLDIIHSHGSDAMRFTLAGMTTNTQDVRMPVARDPATGRNTSEKFDSGRNFANKMWNAVRFALSRLAEAPAQPASADGLSSADAWILARLAATINDATTAVERYEFADYAKVLYDFFWRDLCDWYIEAVKPTVAANLTQRQVLATCIDASLRLSHPVMPFITEKLWEHLNEVMPDRRVDGIEAPMSELLIKAPWPRGDATLARTDVQPFTLVQEIVAAIRQVRTQHKVAPRTTVEISIQTRDVEAHLAQKSLIQTLANVTLIEVGPGIERPADAAVATRGEDHIYLHHLIDPDAERTRLTRRVEELTKSIAAFTSRLANKSYADKAPAHLVQQTRDQLAQAQRELQTINEQLGQLI
jgi:valyl-tRNA synthetase